MIDPKAAAIGDWFAPCCEEDLHQLRTQDDLDDFAEWLEMYQDGEWSKPMVWKTQDEALAYLRAIPVTVLS